ncbi:MAG: amidohydrolase family protein [Spirochaetaceae bacterium]|nr:MAG: amidohydrolase family protein [Spirochaetaceae bacterium]
MKQLTDIVDSHLHLLNLDRFQYYWLKPEFTVLQRSFLAEDVRTVYEANNVSRAVLVQAHPSKAETEYLVELAREHCFIGGVIAHIDLTSEQIEQDLSELQEHGIIKGARHQRAEDEEENWFLKPEVLRGLKAVSAAGLVYDLLVKPRHLTSIPVLMDRVPDIKIVLEHMGKPPIASGACKPWMDDLFAIARITSVRCKISELVTQADWSAWRDEDLKPYIEHALDCFGPDRLMWGSGWPVCLLAAGFEQTLGSTLAGLGSMSETELEKIFRENARRFYDID